MKKPLTKKEKELLDFIASYYEKHDYMPTYSEMSRAFGLLHAPSIQNRLRALFEKGYLKRLRYKHRGLIINKK